MLLDSSWLIWLRILLRVWKIARNLPIADSLKQIITGKKPEESPANGDKFPPVK